MCPKCKHTNFKITLGVVRCLKCGLTDQGRARSLKGWRTRRRSKARIPALTLSFISMAFIILLGSFSNEVTTYAAVEEVKEEQAYLGIEHRGIVTAYNSLPEQTDDTPFETASGERTRDGIVANNCLKFGTKVVINGKTYEVQDRMNKRYGCERYDIWMEYKSDAVHFGTQKLEVIEMI